MKTGGRLIKHARYYWLPGAGVTHAPGLYSYGVLARPKYYLLPSGRSCDIGFSRRLSSATRSALSSKAGRTVHS